MGQGTNQGMNQGGNSTITRVVLLALFAGSGCSALIYEIVWYQLLQLAIGSTAVSLGILLATFMGGLFLGSLALPRLAARRAAHPLRVYGGIELAIGVLGLLELALIPAIEGFYIGVPQAGLAGMLLRGVVCALCLLPPTVLMGASLPAIARWAGGPRGASWWAMLYAANTLGAVLGCLAAGFYLLRLYDVNITSFAAAAINFFVALASFLFAARSAPSIVSEPEAPSEVAADATLPTWAVPLVIGVSGACALGAEVVWTRLMGLMLGATVYAFSIILAVFLVGLALGTAAGSAFLRGVSPSRALGWCQLLAALGIAWTAYMVSDALPFWPVDPLLSTSPKFTFEIDLVRCLWALLPPTILWGASFPLAFAAARRQGDAGKIVGGVYAANTFGAILGALGVSLVLIPLIGTQNTERLLLALSVAGGLVLLLPSWWRQATPELVTKLCAVLAVAVLLVGSVDAAPGELIAYGRRMPLVTGQSTILFTAEGRNTSIAVSRWHADQSLQFHVAGKVEASTNAVDMKLQRMLGHLAALQSGGASGPHSVLIVGFGAGVTAGSFTTYPGISRIVICELEPLIPPTSTRYFYQQNYDVKDDKRTQIIFDDARHFVLTTPEHFDVITSDPIHPFVKGSAALYSKEYFEMEKAHLNPGGVVTQWVPLYESDVATVKSEIATFLAVFPDGMIFANTDNGGGYDLVMLGQKDARPVNIDAIQAKLDSPAYARVRNSLDEVGIGSAQALLSTYAGSGDDLKSWLADAQINQDKSLRLQYLAGLSLNVGVEDMIYRQILAARRLPARQLTGSPAALGVLYGAMTAPAGDVPAE
jgi:spermidine synthase